MWFDPKWAIHYSHNFLKLYNCLTVGCGSSRAETGKRHRWRRRRRVRWAGDEEARRAGCDPRAGRKDRVRSNRHPDCCQGLTRLPSANRKHETCEEFSSSGLPLRSATLINQFMLCIYRWITRILIYKFYNRSFSKSLFAKESLCTWKTLHFVLFCWLIITQEAFFVTKHLAVLPHRETAFLYFYDGMISASWSPLE